MPEMPEVETMVSRLQSIVGYRLAEVLTKQGEDTERYNNFSFEKQEDVPPLITGIYRRGKFIVFMLSNNKALICHNAMSGYWDNHDDPWTFDYVEGKRESSITDVKTLLKLWDESTPGVRHIRLWRFHDTRKFGYLKIVTPEFLAEKLSKLGPEADHTPNLYEPSEVMTPEKFDAICESKKTIKELLLDQNKIAGVGNIYAAEALWYAGIDPRRVAKTLPSLGTNSRFALFLAIRSVLRQALERRLDYSGLRVYRRDECYVCKSKITAEDIKGRTTYWCPTCQT